MILNDFLLECNPHLSILKINFKQSHLWFNFEFVNFKLTFWIEWSIWILWREPFDLKTFELKENQLNELKWIHLVYLSKVMFKFSILNWILPLQFLQFNSWFLILQRECDVMLMLLLLIKKNLLPFFFDSFILWIPLLLLHLSWLRSIELFELAMWWHH